MKMGSTVDGITTNRITLLSWDTTNSERLRGIHMRNSTSEAKSHHELSGKSLRNSKQF